MPPEASLWLVPFHVPGHWTLVTMSWSSRAIAFHDSLPEKDYEQIYTKKAQRLARRLIDFVREQYDVVTETSRAWSWTTELVRDWRLTQLELLINRMIQRPPRQNNGSDCGAFVAADCVALARRGQLSARTQSQMADWRQEMTATLRSLPVYLKTASKGHTDTEMIEISDDEETPPKTRIALSLTDVIELSD